MSDAQPGTKKIVADKAAMAEAVATALIQSINEVAASGRKCSLVLSGGSTPKLLYQRLAARKDEIPWDQLLLFWGDERFVPHDDAASNYRMVKEAMLDHVPLPAEQIYPMPTDAGSPEAAASTYEDELGQALGGTTPRFDIVLLGLGTDGHTASLFPHTDAIDEDAWVTVGEAPSAPHQRLTLTFELLNNAAQAHFLIAGTDKAAPFREMLAQPIDADARPAGAIRLTDGQLTYWLDEAAANA